MLLVLEPEEIDLKKGGTGLAIQVRQFSSIPGLTEEGGQHVALEVLRSTLYIHVWDGTSDDPTTFKVPKSIR